MSWLPLRDDRRDLLQLSTQRAHIQNLGKACRRCHMKDFLPGRRLSLALIFACHLNVAATPDHLKWSAALVIEVRAPDTADLLRLAVAPNCGVIGQFLPTCRGCAKLLSERHPARPA